jgi:ERCC4-type nuclease
MYIIDVRERDLIRLLGTPQTQALPIADIWIGVEEATEATGGAGTGNAVAIPTLAKNAILIERKTIRDLEASILDGRYREQKARLMAFCQEQGATPMYVLEGSYFTTTGRLSPQALMKIVARLQCKYKIAVIHTQSTAETSQLIEALHAQHKEDPTQFATDGGDPSAKTSVETIHVQKKVNAGQPKHFATASLAQCPGVSAKMADVLTAHFTSWDQIMSASQEAIEAIVQPNGRRVGPAVAARLFDLLHTGW